MGYLLLLLMFCCSYALSSALAMSSLPHSSSTVLERWISNIQIYTFYWLEFIFRETPALWCPGSFCLVSVWSWVWSVFSCFWSVSNWELLLEKSSVWSFLPTSSLSFGLTGFQTFFDQVKCAQIKLCSMSEREKKHLKQFFPSSGSSFRRTHPEAPITRMDISSLPKHRVTIRNCTNSPPTTRCTLNCYSPQLRVQTLILFRMLWYQHQQPPQAKGYLP